MAKQVKTSQQAQSNWSGAMQDPKTAAKYSAGIDRTTANPMALAAAADQLFLQKVTDAVNSGRRAAKLNSVDPNYWKSQAKSVGAPALQKGAAKGATKYARFAQNWQGIWQQASDAAHSIPKAPGMDNAQQRWAAAVSVFMANKGR